VSHLRALVVAVSLCLIAGGFLLVVWPAPGPVPSGAGETTAAPTVIRGKVYTFKVIRHTARYDVVSGHSRRFTLEHGARRVSVDGMGRCSVVKRSERRVSLRSPLHAPLVLTDAHDLVFEGLDFEGRGSGYGDVSGIILIQGASHNITFRDCIIGTNRDGVGNGVKIIDFGHGMHDITFINCTFKYQPKMGFECIGRSNPAEGGTGGPGYRRINILGCTFKAGAGQAISYDDNYSAVNPAGDCLVANNRIEGGGVGSSYQYGSVIENNGVHDMTWKNNYFGAGRDSIVNINGRDNEPLDMVSTGNVFDATYVAKGISPRNQIMVIHNVRGGVRFADRIINDPGHYSGTWAYLSNCTGIDFGRSTVENITGAPWHIYGNGNSNIVWPVEQ
jgi:hypothetical protein